MDNLELLRRRRSIRSFQEKGINKGDLEKIIDCARFAPTARDVQPWEFVVITDKSKLKKIAQLAENGRFIAQSSACVAVFCSETKYYLEDGCAATCSLLLAAAAMGIGSCWVAGDKKDYCRPVAELLNAPEGVKLVSLVVLGYPLRDGSFTMAQKRQLGELLHWEKF